MNSLWEKISDIFGGNVIETVSDVVDKFVDTKGEKEERKIEVTKLMQKFEIAVEKADLAQQAEFNNRIKDLEGTAKDLSKSGWMGKVIIFLRGSQRPIWGYSVMVMDFLVFSAKWDISGSEKLESAFWVINLLVLGFLFGERAVKNVAPILMNKFKK